MRTQGAGSKKGSRRPATRHAARSHSTRATSGTLTPDRVVQTAVRLAERQGLDAISMRTLATELGVEAMSLYSHVPSKQVLLGRMASHVVNTVPTPRASLPPRERLLRLARAIRASAGAHPNVFPLVVLLPLEIHSAARFTEFTLQAFIDAGLTDTQAIRGMRLFLSYVRGYVLWEIGGFAAGRRASPTRRVHPQVLGDVERLEPELFPQTRRLARTMVRTNPDTDFRDGCIRMLDAMLHKRGTRA